MSADLPSLYYRVMEMPVMRKLADEALKTYRRLSIDADDQTDFQLKQARTFIEVSPKNMILIRCWAAGEEAVRFLGFPVREASALTEDDYRIVEDV